MKVPAEIHEAAAALKTSPARLCDWIGISPFKLEQLLEARGQYTPDSDVSVRDAVARFYGEDAAAKVEKGLGKWFIAI